MEKLELSALLRQARNYEKAGVSEDGPKVAVLGSRSTQYFVKVFRYCLAKTGMNCPFYEGEYHGIDMDVLDQTSRLYQFAPDYVILLPFWEDVQKFPPLLADKGDVEQHLEAVKRYFQGLWERLGAIRHVRVLQGNFVIPPIRLLGNLEYQEESSRNRFLQLVNEVLFEDHPPHVTIVDLEALSCNIGKYQWFDYPSYFANKAAVRLDYLPEVAQTFVRQIQAQQGHIRKCLVLDLDNTLWGGVVGDDGYEGIQLDPNNAVGEAFRSFQAYCLALRQRGVLLAVCSKNEEATAKEPFEKNEDMILHLEDIACFIANWKNKAENLQSISQILNIGVDSLVFFDDNPAERAIVKQYLPEVHVVEVPDDPALYVLQMEQEQPFDWLQITKEDLERTASYQENGERDRLLERFVDYGEYLQALDMKGETGNLQQQDVGRFVQLLNKSNQFNLRTVRYTEAEVMQMMGDDTVRCLYGKLRDRFGSYGLISCVILRKNGQMCAIDSWVMSCRVLKRGVENMMFNAILEAARDMECTSLWGEYIQTKKNQMVATFYEDLGFSVLNEKVEGNGLRKEYVLYDLRRQASHCIKQRD